MSCIVKMHYWQPYRLDLPPKMSWPPLASPLKKAGAAISVASIPHDDDDNNNNIIISIFV